MSSSGFREHKNCHDGVRNNINNSLRKLKSEKSATSLLEHNGYGTDDTGGIQTSHDVNDFPKVGEAPCDQPDQGCQMVLDANASYGSAIATGEQRHGSGVAMKHTASKHFPKAQTSLTLSIPASEVAMKASCSNENRRESPVLSKLIPLLGESMAKSSADSPEYNFNDAADVPGSATRPKPALCVLDVRRYYYDKRHKNYLISQQLSDIGVESNHIGDGTKAESVVVAKDATSTSRQSGETKFQINMQDSRLIEPKHDFPGSHFSLNAVHDSTSCLDQANQHVPSCTVSSTPSVSDEFQQSTYSSMQNSSPIVSMKEEDESVWMQYQFLLENSEPIKEEAGELSETTREFQSNLQNSPENIEDLAINEASSSKLGEIFNSLGNIIWLKDTRNKA